MNSNKGIEIINDEILGLSKSGVDVDERIFKLGAEFGALLQSNGADYYSLPFFQGAPEVEEQKKALKTLQKQLGNQLLILLKRAVADHLTRHPILRFSPVEPVFGGSDFDELAQQRFNLKFDATNKGYIDDFEVSYRLVEPLSGMFRANGVQEIFSTGLGNDYQYKTVEIDRSSDLNECFFDCTAFLLDGTTPAQLQALTVELDKILMWNALK